MKIKSKAIDTAAARDFADRIETFVATVTGYPARKATKARGGTAAKNGRHFYYNTREREMLVCIRPGQEPVDSALLTNWIVTAAELDLDLQLMPASTLYLSLGFRDCLGEGTETEGAEAEGIEAEGARKI